MGIEPDGCTAVFDELYGHLSEDELAAEIDRLRQEAVEADRAGMSRDSQLLRLSVGQLMRANPTMTFREAMTQLGYWKAKA